MTDKESRDLEKFFQKKQSLKASSSPTKIEGHQIIPIELDQEENETFADKVYREISILNGQINRMNISQLKNACKDLSLDCYGTKDPLKKRLKEHYKVQKLISAGLMEAKANRNADFLIIIDFEATCEERNPSGYPHEIIEFPAVLVASKEAEIIDVFHAFVKPKINPQLSEFCKALTGIEQEVVDKADLFPEVLVQFENWMKSHNLGLTKTYMIVTDGPFDMGRFLYLQCQHSELEFPAYGSHWANLRKVFVNFYRESFYKPSSNNNSQSRMPGLQTMLDRLGMDFEGHPHCGLDDAKNIARIVVRLLKDQAVIRVNEKVQKVGAGVDDSNRCNGKLFSVVPVTKREADTWFKQQKKYLLCQPDSSTTT